MLRDLQDIRGDVSEFEKAILMVHECIESVVYGEETIHRVDMTQDEITEFIEEPKSDHVNPKNSDPEISEIPASK